MVQLNHGQTALGSNGLGEALVPIEKVVAEDAQLSRKALAIFLDMGGAGHGESKVAFGTHGQPMEFVVTELAVRMALAIGHGSQCKPVLHGQSARETHRRCQTFIGICGRHGSFLGLHGYARGDTAMRVADAVNEVFGPDVAVPLDASTIKVRAPVDPSQKVSFVSLLENIEVEPARPSAKVIVNSRTGTIVIGGDVRVTPSVVTHGSLTVRINEDKEVIQATNIAQNQQGIVATPGAAQVNDDTEIIVEQEPARAFVFDPGIELSDVVDAINGVGASPADLVAILEALREAGSLRAEIIVI